MSDDPSYRRPLPIVEREGDMGEKLKLQLLRDVDGDIIVSILPVNHKFSDAALEFCVPGIGGGRSPRTYDALANLMRAMEDDIAESPNYFPTHGGY